MKCPNCHSENPETQRFCGECGEALDSTESADLPDLSVTKTLETPTDQLTRGGTFANRYEIIEELGKGGMGSVYRAEDTKVKEEVAIKLINPAVAADEQTIERFRNELRPARKITHKLVVLINFTFLTQFNPVFIKHINKRFCGFQGLSE